MNIVFLAFQRLVKCFLIIFILHIYSIRDITKEVAAAVIKEAVEEDLAEGYRDMDARELGKLNKVCFLDHFTFLLCN